MGKVISSDDRLTPYRNLRKLFEQNINVSHIAEPLHCFKVTDPILHIKNYMDFKGYDVVGIERSGVVIGYIKKEDFKKLPFDLIRDFGPTEIVSDSTPLIQLLYMFKDTDRLFVLEANRVTKLVTFADLQKPPIRMLLFGMISLLEMHLLRLILQFYPDGTWKKVLTENRLAEARQLYKQRKARNEEIQLADCLQLCDKKMLIVKNDALRELFSFPSKNKTEEFFTDLESLRNKLAHAQDLTMGTTWKEIIILIEKSEQLLKICEEN